MLFEKHIDELAYAHGGTVGAGQLKQQAEDFIVNERLTFTPSGEGEHEFVYVQKKGLNTDEVLKKLAVHAGVTRRSVSYAGMKDKHAVTKQWFSVHLPGRAAPDWQLLEDDSIKIKRSTRHLKKLKRGVIQFNEFEIVISQLTVDHALLQQRIEQIKMFGVPNYFMQQRFGYLCQNLDRAYGLFSRGEKIKNKQLKGLLLSSARSFLFNQVLSERVKAENWDKAIPGDAFMLSGTRQYFTDKANSTTTHTRLMEHDIHPSGPLFGVNDKVVSASVEQLEDTVFTANSVFCKGLLKEKVDSARRALRVVPTDFKAELISTDKLRLSFKLPSGSYATAVIRELINTTSHVN